MRADALHALLLTPRGTVEAIEEIPSLPDLSGWTRGMVDRAIDALVAEGAIEESAAGRLIVRPPRVDDRTAA